MRPMFLSALALLLPLSAFAAEPDLPAQPGTRLERNGGGNNHHSGQKSGGQKSGSHSSPSKASPSKASPANPAPASPSKASPAPASPSKAPANPTPASPSKAPAPANPSPANKGAPNNAPHAPNSPNNAAHPAAPRPVDTQRVNPHSPAMAPRPSTQHLQIGGAPQAVNAAHPAPVSRSISHAPANFRTSSASAARSANPVPASRINAQHQAATVRQATHIAAAHRTQAIVHHNHMVAVHHAAWAHHHVWHPYRVVVRGAPAVHYWYHPWYPGYPHYWYHGVFVYGPRPIVVHTYEEGGGATAEAAPAEPKRSVDRSGTWAVGLRGGSYLSSYDNGMSYGDAGVGVALRYRPVEALGFEAQWLYNDQSFSAGSERIQQPFSLSAELFAVPWSRFSPYVLAGVTYTGRNINDPLTPNNTFSTDQALWGPHGGVGVDLGLGERASVNFDIRGIGYLNTPDTDAATPGAVQANMGVNFYF